MFIKTPKISPNESRKMIVEMAKYGNHYNDLKNQIKTVKDIKLHYKQNGKNFKKVITHCRTFENPIPIYENLIGAQWTTKGITVSKEDHITGEDKVIISGDGIYNESDYWANFELSKEDFEQAITTIRFERLLASFGAGIAAIEAFLNSQYILRTKCPTDDKKIKCNIDVKFDEWIPMLTGTKFDKSGIEWRDYKIVTDHRNEFLQHRKSIATGIRFEELEKLFNKYRTGICGVLFQLHVLFEVRCPCAIIRLSHCPNIKYVQDSTPVALPTG